MPERPRVPTYEISFVGDAATSAIADLVEDLTITDNLEGEADTIDITLNNLDGRWINEWKFVKGDRITASIGYRDEPMSAPIEFEVDQIDYTFGPDTCKLSGQATPVTGGIREKYSQEYEDISLAEIAVIIAGRNGLAAVGQVPAVQFKRVTQKNENDLAFLRRISLRYGAIFKVESLTKLVFHYEPILEQEPPSVILDRAALNPSSRLREKTVDTYRACKTQYRDPKTTELYEVEVESPRIKVGGILNIVGERYEDAGQAALRAAEALRKANALEIEGTLDVEGEVGYVAGLNIELTGFHKLSGIYQCRKAVHKISVGRGYTCSLDIRGITVGDGYTPT